MESDVGRAGRFMLEDMARVLLVLAFLAAAVLLVMRALRWTRGSRGHERTRWLRGWLDVPRRYLVDVHDIVSREPRVSQMHILAAGGFVACTVLAVLTFVAGLQFTLLHAATAAASVALMLGACLAFLRRRVRRPARLSGGAYEILPAALAGYALFFGFSVLSRTGWLPIEVSSPAGMLLALAGAGAATFLIPGLAAGPMRHASAGVVHLAYPTRPARFTSAQGSTELRALDLSSPHLGVEKNEDFAWNQLLSFDACVQCGRCESVCPAHAAGTPLNPKKLIYDLARDAAIAPEVIWACTTCRACVEECPMMIEHVDAVVDMRRFLTLEKGETAGSGPRVLDNIELTDNVDGQKPSARMLWAADLRLPLAEERKSFGTLLWMGQGAFDPRHQRTLRALVDLLRHANVDFAVLGEAECDCGDIARRLGHEAVFQKLAQANIELLKRYRFDRIVTADPHALHTIRNEYPAFGGVFKVVHHSALIAELITSGSIIIEAAEGAAQSVTYHDPCYLGRYNGEYESPRLVLERLGLDVREMERSRRRSFCCGGGGGAPITDVPSARRMPDMRLEQAQATGAGSVVAACPGCMAMFEGVAGRRVEVHDLAELVAARLAQRERVRLQ